MDSGFVDGIGNIAKFNRPNGIAISRQGSIFIADFGNSAIRRVSVIGEVSTIAGGKSVSTFQNGLAPLAAFLNPRGLVFDTDGNLYIADFGNNLIRQIDGNLEVTTLAGSGAKKQSEGEAKTASFEEIRDVTYFAGYIFAIDRYKIRRISRTGSVVTWAGGTESGLWDGVGAQARFGTLSAITADTAGNLYVVDADNSAIRYITQMQKVGTLAGADVTPPDGSNTFLQQPVGIAVDKEGNCWVSDVGDYTIKKITPKGVITQIAGSLKQGHLDGAALSAEFQHPSGIGVGLDGRIYVTDIATHSLRCLIPHR
jgi:DNA-binding beta-propeller fold protein YncE